jgi:hypothetical protein
VGRRRRTVKIETVVEVVSVVIIIGCHGMRVRLLAKAVSRID